MNPPESHRSRKRSVQHHRSGPRLPGGTNPQFGSHSGSSGSFVPPRSNAIRSEQPAFASFHMPTIGFQRPRSSGPEPIPLAPPATGNPTPGVDPRSSRSPRQLAQHRLLPGAWNKQHRGEAVTVIKASVRAPYESQPYRIEITLCCCGDTPPRTTDNTAVALHNPYLAKPHPTVATA